MAFGDSLASSFLSAQQQQLQQALAIADQHWKEQQAQRQDASQTEQTDYHNRLIDRYDKDRQRNIEKDQDLAGKALATEKQQRFKDAGQRHKDALAQGLDEDTALAIAGYDPEIEQNIRQAGSRGGNQANMQQALQQSPAHYLPPEQSQGPQTEQQGLPAGGLGDLLGSLGGVMGAGGGLPSMSTGPGAMAGPRMMEPAGGTAQPFDFGSAQSPAYLEAQRVKEGQIAAAKVRTESLLKTTAVQQAKEARLKEISDIQKPGLKALASLYVEKLAAYPRQSELMNEARQATIQHMKSVDTRLNLTDSNKIRQWNANQGRLERTTLSGMDTKYNKLRGDIRDAQDAVVKDDKDLAKIKANPNFANDPALQGQAEAITMGRQLHVDNLNAVKDDADVLDTSRNLVRRNLITVGILNSDGSPVLDRMPSASTPDIPAPKGGGLPALPGTGYTPSPPAPSGRNAPIPGGTPDRRTPAQRFADSFTWRKK